MAHPARRRARVDGVEGTTLPASHGTALGLRLAHRPARRTSERLRPHQPLVGADVIFALKPLLAAALGFSLSYRFSGL